MRLHSVGEGLTECDISDENDSFTRDDVRTLFFFLLITLII